jgi:prepilin-type N-terminal cleavage/methylation domain-containing protein
MRAQARGFTLVEMLVTLVVVGLVSTLLWQALAQVAQLETRLADGRALADGDRLRRAWVQQALAGIATGPLGTREAVAGTPDTLSSFTTLPPWPDAGGLQRMTLRLTTERQDGQVVVTLTATADASQQGGSPGREAPALWRWPGEGRFEYLAADGQWLPRWPPTAISGVGAEPAPPRLPVAVRLLGPPSGALLVPIVADTSPLISRRDVMDNDDARR